LYFIEEERADNVTHAMGVVRNLLAAMKLNSEKARLRFPRLLQILDEFPATRDEFAKMVCFVEVICG